MRDLQALEICEIEVLEALNSIKALDNLFFGGGTMLRLCHNLNRFSTDLDFWIRPEIDAKKFFSVLHSLFRNRYRIDDAAHKRFTILFEIQAPNLRRHLKIEIRKNQGDFEWERKIAFSSFAVKQVMVQGLTLRQMMKNKTAAALTRKLIRDIFDIEFLFMCGTEMTDNKVELRGLREIMQSFKERDYKVTLGSILEEKDRRFQTENRFRLLQEEITRRLR